MGDERKERVNNGIRPKGKDCRMSVKVTNVRIHSIQEGWSGKTHSKSLSLSWSRPNRQRGKSMIDRQYRGKVKKGNWTITGKR